MPSEEEVNAHGISLGEMDANLPRKVEELTLYLLEMEKENQALKARVGNLEADSGK